MKGQSLLIAALLFAFLIALFAVINVDSVRVNFLFTQAQIPLILVILASTLLGGLTIGLFGGIRQFKLQRAVRTLEKQLAEFTAEAAPPEADRLPGESHINEGAQPLPPRRSERLQDKP